MVFPLPRKNINTGVVLFSSKDKAWKLADFGLTSEGTSQGNHNTEFSRGTVGYRAPELLLEDNKTYNNKVDIWAMGCILYELIVGRKAFVSDSAVLEFARTGVSLELRFNDAFGDESKAALSKCVYDMVHIIAPVRPNATVLFQQFSIYYEQKQKRENSWRGARVPTLSSSLLSKATQTDKSELRANSETKKWIISEAVVNRLNTRVAVISYDDAQTMFWVQLWDITLRTVLWQRQELLGEPLSLPPCPTFSEDGDYLAVWFGGCVEVMNTWTLERVSNSSIMRRPTAVSIWNEKTMALSAGNNVDEEFLNVEPAAVLQPRLFQNNQQRVDVILTTGMNNIALSYLARGRRLFIVGDHPGSSRIMIHCWDPDSGTLLNRHFLINSSRFASLSTITLAARPCLIICSMFVKHDAFKSGLDLYTSDNEFIAEFAGSDMVYGNSEHGFLVLTNGPIFSLNRVDRSWISLEGNQEQWGVETGRKYLWQWEGSNEGLSCLGTVEFDDLQSLCQVKGLVENQGRVTLILENGRFVSGVRNTVPTYTVNDRY